MKRENVNYLAVGSFVLVAVVLLLGVLYKLTGRVGDSDSYHVHFDNITGLTDGSRVTYEGYQVGFVAGVTPEQGDAGTRYRVELRVKERWKIPTDSVARIYSSGLLAETVINIEEGAARAFLQPGAEIAGLQGGDMFAALGTVADDIGALTRDTLRPLLENIDRQVTDLGGELGTRMPRILNDLESMAHKLDMSADGLNEMLNEQHRRRVGNILVDVEATAKNFHRLSSGLQDTKSELDGLLGDTRDVVGDNREDLRISVLALRRTLDSLSREVETILLDLSGASRNVHEFSREVRHNPGVLLNGRPAAEQGVQSD